MFLKNTLKNFLIASLFVSSIARGETFKVAGAFDQIEIAFKHGQNKKMIDDDFVIGVLFIIAITAFATTIATNSVLTYKYIKHINVYKNTCQESKKQCEILNKFYEDPTFTYENLLIEARNLYFETNLCSEDLLGEYPTVWLEINTALNIQTTASRNWKNLIYFDTKYRDLGEKLETLLLNLRNNPEFQKDRHAYYEKLRESNFNDNILLTKQTKRPVISLALWALGCYN